jgi:60 kDa SS-A/Ro ribonucleoprotein
VFSGSAAYVSLNPADSLFTMTSQIPRRGQDTDFHSIFRTANKAYDRIIVLSDMQGWAGHRNPTGSYAAYCQGFGCRPRLYMMDLAGYGDMMFPTEMVYCMAGFNDRVFEVMQLLETDQNALVNKIESIKL